MRATIAQPPPRRTLVAWAMFDWANSAFATLVVTFVYATYFTTAIAADEVTGYGAVVTRGRPERHTGGSAGPRRSARWPTVAAGG